MSERRIEYMKLHEVQAAARNPKQHALRAIRGSVDRFGFVEVPTLDERTGRLVAGHGRIETLTALHKDGLAPPDGVHLDGDEWLVPVLRGWASKDEKEAEAYLVASNKLTEAGGWDDEALAALLADQGDVGKELGFLEAELRELLDANPLPVAPPEIHEWDASPVKAEAVFTVRLPVDRQAEARAALRSIPGATFEEDIEW